MAHIAIAEPWGSMPERVTPAKIGIYAFLVITALFFAIPLYVMLATSLKTMQEIRLGNIFAFPLDVTFSAWVKAWSVLARGSIAMASRSASSTR